MQKNRAELQVPFCETTRATEQNEENIKMYPDITKLQHRRRGNVIPTAHSLSDAKEGLLASSVVYNPWALV